MKHVPGHVCNRTSGETNCKRRVETREYCHAMFRQMRLKQKIITKVDLRFWFVVVVVVDNDDDVVVLMLLLLLSLRLIR